VSLRRKARPELPIDEFARQARFAKPQYQTPPVAADTSELQHRKLHLIRSEGFKAFIRLKRCAIEKKLDHKCWTPRAHGLSDPAHTTKAGLALKGPDSGLIPLCRLAHSEQELDMDAFDQKYGINRHQIAADLWAQWQQKEARRG
jgi:hypothetical protein